MSAPSAFPWRLGRIFSDRNRAWRGVKDLTFTLVAGAAAFVAIVPLVSVTSYVVKQGWPAISWSFLTHATNAAEPGILNAIQGTAILVGLAMLMGIPLGLFAGAWLAEYGRSGPVSAAFRILLDAMAATPSIVIGLFVFTVVVLTQEHYSTLAGAIALGIMIVPVVARTSEISLLGVPDSLREASVALGATHTRTLFRVALPAARMGTVTGAILAAARVAGETAPLIFTSPLVVLYFQGMDRPIASLPMSIYLDISQPYPEAQSRAWGAALVLFVLVFGANVIIRLVSRARRPAS